MASGRPHRLECLGRAGCIGDRADHVGGEAALGGADLEQLVPCHAEVGDQLDVTRRLDLRSGRLVVVVLVLADGRCGQCISENALSEDAGGGRAAVGQEDGDVVVDQQTDDPDPLVVLFDEQDGGAAGPPLAEELGRCIEVLQRRWIDVEGTPPRGRADQGDSAGRHAPILADGPDQRCGRTVLRVHGLVERVLGLPAGGVLAAVFLLPALEASLFIGVIFPGEIAVLLGGVVAGRGDVSLAAVLVCAIAGAVLGDQVGYLVGRRWGEGLLARLPARLVKPEHLQSGRALVRRLGARAVLLGRWTASLRALVPGLAGLSGIPYRRFVVANAVGGTLWATAVVLAGYVAGDHYSAVERAISAIGYAGAALVIALLIVLLLVRRRRTSVSRTSEGPAGVAGPAAPAVPGDTPR